MSDRVRVFAYGSNLDSERMRSRTPSARVLDVASLPEHDLRFHKRGGDCGTAKADAFHTGDDDHRVHGVVYEIVRDELPDLDRAEAVGVGYDRVTRRVELGRGDAVEAWVYLAREDQIESGLRPFAWYLEHVRRGAREHGLPARLHRRLALIQPV